MLDSEKQKILHDMKAWCYEVGAFQRQHFRSDNLQVQVKESLHDLVTNVDKKSEELLIERINRHYPGTAILAEESGASGASEATSGRLWVIDPLDGTNNYVQGLPVFAISLALQEKGETQVGVVYAPYLDEMYYALRGGGAFFQDKPLAVSRKQRFGECVLGTGFPYDKGTHPANNVDYFARLLPQLRGVRRMGAAAYDLCAVAAGYLDGYWELNLKLWDIAAGMLIVQEAGGSVLKFREDRQWSIIAANPELAKLMLTELNAITNQASGA